MRYTGIWEDQRQAQRQGMKKKSLFSLFLSSLYQVWLCVCGRVLHFFFFLIIFLHVHVKYIVVTSPTSFCSYKPQILYHCYCHVCLAQWCILPSPPAYIMFVVVIILFAGYGPINTASDDLSHKNSSWWGMTFTIESRITPWLTSLSHSSTGCLCLVEPGCILSSLTSPGLHHNQPYSMLHSFSLSQAKNQIWHKAA